MSTTSRFLSTAATIATLVAAFPISGNADEATSHGIITSISNSATISTQGMPPGSEMWGMWVSLPAGKKVEMSVAKIPSIWMDLEVVLSGTTVSAVSSGKIPPGECFLFRAGGQQEFTGQEITNKPGDAFACNFGTGLPSWQENRGTELYSVAQLNIGGPWAPGQSDTPDEYRMAGGDSRALNVDAVAFSAVEKELRTAGMMTATTKVVTMPPGSRSAATDRYPTLRMVTSGELKWGTVPAGSEVSAAPKLMFKKSQFDWVYWTDSGQVVLSNESDKSVEFVEWSVAPAAGVVP